MAACCTSVSAGPWTANSAYCEVGGSQGLRERCASRGGPGPLSPLEPRRCRPLVPPAAAGARAATAGAAHNVPVNGTFAPTFWDALCKEQHRFSILKDIIRVRGMGQRASGSGCDKSAGAYSGCTSHWR